MHTVLKISRFCHCSVMNADSSLGNAVKIFSPCPKLCIMWTSGPYFLSVIACSMQFSSLDELENLYIVGRAPYGLQDGNVL